MRLQEDRILVTTRSHVRCLNPTTGFEHWSYEAPENSSGNPLCASPLIYADEIFHSGWYGIGLHRTRITNDTPTHVWNLDNLVSSHYASLIHQKGYLNGYHGHATKGPTLRCVKVATREVVWEENHGSAGTITQLGDQLLILTDQGELMLVRADPEKCSITGRMQVTRRYTRSYPAIANGFVYLKGPRRLVCLDLRPAQE